MAEAIIGGVVQSVADLVGSLLKEEVGLAGGVKAELRNLRGTVSTIQAVLGEAEKRQVENKVVRDWLKKLGEVAYEADDLLDDFSTEVMRRGSVTGQSRRILNEFRIFFSSSNWFIYALKMAHQVKDIRSKIDLICKEKDQFKFDGNAGSYPESSGLISLGRETISFMHELNVIGRDNDKKKIMEFLSDHSSEENVTILAIVGIGGLGKTTLARTVFNDKGVKDNFELKLWVCVATKFINVEDILRKMLKQCGSTEKAIADLNMNDLAIELGKQLDGKKYLLVLDDVWNVPMDEWSKLEGYLMKGSKGSKVLVTTREPRAANIMTGKCHKLRGLEEDDALSLLMRLTRKQEHVWKGKHLEVIAKEILQKCVGVPLAIRTIAGILLEKNTEEEWSTFRNHELSRISQEEGIMSTLKLSYDFMPPYLKPCFSYCCMFPKGYQLNPDELIHLWMAQGFIEQKISSDKQTMEEVGKDYLVQLVLRNLFIEVEKDVCDNVIKCRMHDLIHDLAQTVVGGDCVSIESFGRDSIPEGARHVSFSNAEGSGGSKRDFRVRSLLLHADYSKRIDISNLDLACFRYLRALRLRNAQIRQTITESIGELKHLRCLDLSGNYNLESLPNSISKLLNLQTLILWQCLLLEELPRGITKLVNLKKLDASGCDRLMHMPRGIGKLTNLQVLLGFVVGKQGIKDAASLGELSSLSRLRELSIRNLERLTESDASFSMKKFDHLQSLELVWKYDVGRTPDPVSEEFLERMEPHRDLKRLKLEGYKGTRVPSWLSQQRKLVDIEIVDCKECKHLPPLDGLPCLKRIYLERMSSLEYIELSDESNFFSSLEEVKLSILPGFRGWERKRSILIEDEGIAVEKDTPSSSSSPLLKVHTFSDNINVTVYICPRFHWMHGQGQLLELGVTSKEMLHQLCPNATTTTCCSSPASPAITIEQGRGRPLEIISTSLSSISLTKLTSLIITEIDDMESLPLELFPSLSSLLSLEISYCRQLKCLPGEVILRYLTSLERLFIYGCPELEFSTEDDDSESVRQGHCKLRIFIIWNCDKMETLPGWFRCLSNLQELYVWNCSGLKSLLPARQLVGLFTSLQVLRLEYCPELDLTIKDEFKLEGHTQLQELTLQDIGKLDTLPWWVRHLNRLEMLVLEGCQNMKALPEWFPSLSSLRRFEVRNCGELSRRLKDRTGEDLQKVSHIPNVIVME